MDIQAITFDVGGTLIRPWPSVGDVYTEVAARYGHKDLQPAMLNRQFAAAWRAKTHFDHSRPAWLELVEKTFAGSLDDTAIPEFFEDLYERFAAPEAWRVFKDVHPALATLRQGPLKLGVISNWDERLRPLLASLKLSSYFEVIVISIEAGFTKPAREIFDRAASLLSVPAQTILHVGDSLEEDFAGARAAGFLAVLLDREGTQSSVPSIRTLAGLISAAKPTP